MGLSERSNLVVARFILASRGKRAGTSPAPTEVDCDGKRMDCRSGGVYPRLVGGGDGRGRAPPPRCRLSVVARFIPT